MPSHLPDPPPGQPRYVLRLFVAGSTPSSLRAIGNLRKLLDRRLAGRYDLDIVDLYQHPDQAAAAQLVAAPTLLKELPLPIRRLVGTMDDEGRVLVGLGLVDPDHDGR